MPKVSHNTMASDVVVMLVLKSVEANGTKSLSALAIGAEQGVGPPAGQTQVASTKKVSERPEAFSTPLT